jgi:hypothetical protein
MKIMQGPAIVPMLALIAAAPFDDPAIEAATTVSRNLSNQFQKELGAALQSAIKTQGTAGAVTACATIAPEVASRISAQSGASVRRTTLRARNPQATPDGYERTVLAVLGALPTSSEGPPNESAGWTGTDADRRFRYLRAIPTAPMCLSCHGSNIAPDVAKAIAAHYPADKATGFAAGDMRGAFSISWTPQALAAALAKPTRADTQP